MSTVLSFRALPIGVAVDVLTALLIGSDAKAAGSLRVAAPVPAFGVELSATFSADRPADVLDWAVSALRRSFSPPQDAWPIAPVVLAGAEPAPTEGVRHARTLHALHRMGGPKLELNQRPEVTVLASGAAAAELLSCGARRTVPPFALIVHGPAPSLQTLAPPLFVECPPPLTVLDLSACTGVRTLTDAFFGKCPLLRRLVLPPSVRTLDDSFCAYHAPLAHVDLSRCTQLTSIADGFAERCPSLKRVDLPSSLTSIDDAFCAESAELNQLNLSGCAGLKHIGHAVLLGCASLRLVVPAAVEYVGNRFCKRAVCLTELDMSACAALHVLTSSASRLTYSFVECCLNLRRFVPPPDLERIEACCFMDVTSLKLLDFSDCAQLTWIGEQFATRCTSLTTVRFPASVTHIGKQCCAGAAALAEFDLTHCTNLKRVDEGFTAGCAPDFRVALPAGVEFQHAAAAS